MLAVSLIFCFCDIKVGLVAAIAHRFWVDDVSKQGQLGQPAPVGKQEGRRLGAVHLNT